MTDISKDFLQAHVGSFSCNSSMFPRVEEMSKSSLANTQIEADVQHMARERPVGVKDRLLTTGSLGFGSRVLALRTASY
jgi:hypothetical protein